MIRPGVSPAGMSAPRLDREEHIVLAHGGGGQLTDELLTAAVLPRLGGPALAELLDAGILEGTNEDRLALTVDGYVVTPWRFPGGDIGRLAVSGTINDLAVCGARPCGLALGLILAEGLARRDLERILDSIATTAAEAGVPVVTGDTKVVGRAQADEIYITTAGVGRVPRERRLSPQAIRPGDVLLVNGHVGDHGLAVLLARELPSVESAVRSDAAPLNQLIERLLECAGEDVAFMRDPTRAGLAGVASDLARHSGWHISLEEAAIPVRPEVRHAAELLGLDPLDIANEGKVVAVVRPAAAPAALDVLRGHPLGRHAAIIGQVEDVQDGVCELRTTVGGRRIVQKPYGEQLPRIC
jgi:hydrogenase expression/formation protein HypE